MAPYLFFFNCILQSIDEERAEGTRNSEECKVIWITLLCSKSTHAIAYVLSYRCKTNHLDHDCGKRKMFTVSVYRKSERTQCAQNKLPSRYPRYRPQWTCTAAMHATSFPFSYRDQVTLNFQPHYDDHLSHDAAGYRI